MPDTDGFDPYSVSYRPQLLIVSFDCVSTEIESWKCLFVFKKYCKTMWSSYKYIYNSTHFPTVKAISQHYRKFASNVNDTGCSGYEFTICTWNTLYHSSMKWLQNYMYVISYYIYNIHILVPGVFLRLLLF